MAADKGISGGTLIVARNDGGEESVQRFDLSRIGKATPTPQGFLKFDAAITRVGVLKYRRADGSVQRELRLPEEVFADKSLATLPGAPLTDLHVEKVTPLNVKQVRVGGLGHDIKHDDQYVKAVVTVEDHDTIEKVDSGERKELSAGYRCRIDATPGEYKGEQYDVIQRGIEYNHVAIGPDGWGRAGSDVALRLDGDAALSLDSSVSGVITQKGDENSAGAGSVVTEPRAGESKMKRHIRIDGIEHEIEGNDAAFQAFDVWVQKRDKAEAELRSELAVLSTKADGDTVKAKADQDALQGKFDAQEKELKESKESLEKASDPARLDTLVNDRAELVGKARDVLGKDEKLDGKTPREIKDLVIQKIDPEIKLDGKSDDYVDGLFDQSVRNHKPAERSDGIAGARGASTPTPPASGGKDKPLTPWEARQKMRQDSADAWRPKDSA